jgi:hypothetical protein
MDDGKSRSFSQNVRNVLRAGRKRKYTHLYVYVHTLAGRGARTYAHIKNVHTLYDCMHIVMHVAGASVFVPRQ